MDLAHTITELWGNLQRTIWPERRTIARAQEPLGARNLIRRRERLSEGFISSERMLTPRPCAIRDMTLLGCRVDLWEDIHPSMLQDGVTLYSLKDRKEADAEVVWHRGVSLGLRFRTGLRETKRTYRV